MRKSLRFLACFLMLLFRGDASAESKQKIYEASRQQASEATDIYSGGPLEIHGSFHLHLLGGQSDGTYRYVQLSKTEYREEIETPGFSESVLHRDGERYFLRSKNLEPLAIWYLRELIYIAHSVPAESLFSKITTSRQGDRNVKCFVLERGPYGATEYSGDQTCFDAETGVLASIEWSFNVDLHRLEYSQFRRDDKKLFPTTMRRFHNGRLLAEMTIDSLTHASPDQKLFEPPPNTWKRDTCKTFRPAEAEYSREYFQIRSDYKSGSVVIAGSLDDHGKVIDKEIQQSGSSQVDAAAVKALNEVHIHPAKCDGQNVPSFFRLQIWFSPALHPDSFQSFR